MSRRFPPRFHEFFAQTQNILARFARYTAYIQSQCTLVTKLTCVLYRVPYRAFGAGGAKGGGDTCPPDFCRSDTSISTWWAEYAPPPHQIVRPSYGPVMYYTDGWCLTEMTFANSLVTAKKEVLTATCRPQLSQILFKIAWFHYMYYIFHISIQGRTKWRDCRLNSKNPDSQLGWAILA